MLTRDQRKQHFRYSNKAYRKVSVTGAYKYKSVECLVIPRSNDVVCLSFRGSKGFLDWLTNFRFFSTKLDTKGFIALCLNRDIKFGCGITFGSTRPFLGNDKDGWRTQKVLQKQVRELLRQLIESEVIYSGCTIRVDGHSKGGKEAAIAVALLFGIEATAGIEVCANKRDTVVFTPSPRWNFGYAEVNWKNVDKGIIDHQLEDYAEWVE